MILVLLSRLVILTICRSRGVHINMKLIKSWNVNNSIIAQLNWRSDQRKLLNKNHSNAYYSSNNSPREQDNNRHYQKQNWRDLFWITQTQLVGFRENAKYTRPKFIKKLVRIQLLRIDLMRLLQQELILLLSLLRFKVELTSI